jgi:integrase/recombinase XerC
MYSTGYRLIEAFQNHLVSRDLAPGTIRAYLHDLKVFQDWLAWVHETPAAGIAQAATVELAAFRNHLLQEKSRRPATVNRRIQSLRLFFQWLQDHHGAGENPAEHLRYVRYARRQHPVALKHREVLALLRAASASPHGMGRRNTALIQSMLQTGLRVSEVAALRHGDIHIGARSGWVQVRAGKGLKFRQVPLNTTVRRALRAYLDALPDNAENDPVFISKRRTPLSVRAIQNMVAGLASRAEITRIPVSAHTLRHTFASGYLKNNPGKLVELAGLLGHESLDTTVIYTRPSQDDLSADLERSPLNVLGE